MKRRTAIQLCVGAALGAAFAPSLAAVGAVGRGRGSVGNGRAPPGTGFYPSGHYVSAKMPLLQVYPRPVAETQSLAYHLIGYYDGTNAVQMCHQVAVQGGARPLVYQLLEGPPGMAIGEAYGNANYGIITWTPSAAISSASPTTVTVRVYSQDYQTNPSQFIDISWAVYTSSALTDFIFVDSVNGLDTNNGAFATPLKTFAKVMGTVQNTATYPGARVIMKSGTYQWPDNSGSGAGVFYLDDTYTPCVYSCLQGASVTIDATVAQLEGATVQDDWFFGGPSGGTLTISGSCPTPLDQHTIRLDKGNRLTLLNVTFTNPTSRASGTYTNSTSVFGTNSALKSNWAFCNVAETGRIKNGVSNSMLLTVPFSVQNMVMDFCIASGSAGYGVYIKDSNRYVTVFALNSDLDPGSETTTNGGGFCFGCQANLQSSEYMEICYSYIKGGAINFDFQANSTAGAQYSYRNTVYREDTNTTYGILTNGGVGPYSSDNDVLIARGPTLIGSNITASGTEVEASWGSAPPPANNPIDPTTGNLVDNSGSGGTNWTTYLGTRGWQIQ